MYGKRFTYKGQWYQIQWHILATALSGTLRPAAWADTAFKPGDFQAGTDAEMCTIRSSFHIGVTLS